MGISEEEIIDSLIRLCKKIVIQEKNERKNLLSSSRKELEDRAWSAYGLLHNARIISSTEAMELLSKLRFGVELGFVSKISLCQLNQLMQIIQPAYLQMALGKKLKKLEQDFQRAILIRKEFSK